MKITHLTAMTLGIALLSGCVATKDQFETYQTVVQGSGRARQVELKQCLTMKPSQLELRNMALIVDAPENKAVSIICHRVMKGIVSGTLTYDDYLKAQHGTLTPKLIKVVQAR